MPRIGTIVFDGIGPVLDYMAVSTAMNVMEAMEEGAVELESYAQYNAPWSDITGEARGGLTAELYDEAGEIIIELYHTAPHGYWLELIQDGRFAIIMPTLEALGPEIIRRASGKVLDTSGAG